MKMRLRKKCIRKFLVSKIPYPIGKGVQYIYRFPNGKGASVIKVHTDVMLDCMKWQYFNLTMMDILLFKMLRVI